MFFVSIAAKGIDPEAFAWLVFTRTTKMQLRGYNQRHTLVLAKGDVFGIRRTRSNTYQIVKSDALHVIYRNVPADTQDRIMKNSMVYKGPPITEQEVEDGFSRQRRVSTREPVNNANKRVDDFFKPKARIVEKYQIDQNNYQWRKIQESNVRVLSKKQGKIKSILNTGDIVGMRYNTPARGGYVLLDGNNRIHISHETYSEIVHSSRVLPAGQQKDDIVDLGSGLSEAEIKEQMEKEAQERKERKAKNSPTSVEEEPIPQLYDIDGVSDDELLEEKVVKRDKKNRNLRRMVRKLLEVPEQDVWVEEGDAEFEDEEMEDVDAPPAKSNEPETEDVDPDDVEDEDFDDDLDEDLEEDEDDLDEDDLDEEEDEDPDEEERKEQPLVEELQPGTIVQMKKGTKRKYVVIEANPMERNENLIEYILHDPTADEGDDEYSLYRLRLNVNTTLGKFEESAEILDETFGEDTLKEIQDSIEYADIKSISFVK